jgi:hypothetical protein
MPQNHDHANPRRPQLPRLELRKRNGLHSRAGVDRGLSGASLPGNNRRWQGGVVNGGGQGPEVEGTGGISFVKERAESRAERVRSAAS